jgi:hypothetical protein
VLNYFITIIRDSLISWYDGGNSSEILEIYSWSKLFCMYIFPVNKSEHFSRLQSKIGDRELSVLMAVFAEHFIHKKCRLPDCEQIYIRNTMYYTNLQCLVTVIKAIDCFKKHMLINHLAKMTIYQYLNRHSVPNSCLPTIIKM